MMTVNHPEHRDFSWLIQSRYVCLRNGISENNDDLLKFLMISKLGSIGYTCAILLCETLAFLLAVLLLNVFQRLEMVLVSIYGIYLGLHSRHLFSR